VQWLDRGSAKRAADLTHSDVLSNLEDADEGFRCTMRPHGETIEQNWEGDGMEDEAPVVEVNSSNRVAEEQSPEGGLCTRSHDFDVWFPVKLVIDEDAKVAYQRRSTNLESPTARNPQVNRRPESSNMFRVGPMGLERNKFRFVGV